MRKSTLILATSIGVLLSVEPALAESCYDLWYERNSIYDANGFCFKTQLGRQTFDNSDCYTNNVRLSRREQRRVNEIQDEEDARGCHVN